MLTSHPIGNNNLCQNTDMAAATSAGWQGCLIGVIHGTDAYILRSRQALYLSTGCMQSCTASLWQYLCLHQNNSGSAATEHCVSAATGGLQPRLPDAEVPGGELAGQEQVEMWWNGRSTSRGRVRRHLPFSPGGNTSS